ncbi:unnamed protein product [Orchesella dallaii]|uniref:Uncharacterized protein n=1 Tax=Orchesella dallaii TaxID=48710 RepID=A0ABP1R5S8_9HEXA
MSCRRSASADYEDQLRQEFDEDSDDLYRILASLCRISISIQQDYIFVIYGQLQKLSIFMENCTQYHNTMGECLEGNEKKEAASLFMFLKQIGDLCKAVFEKGEVFNRKFWTARNEMCNLRALWMQDNVPDVFGLAMMTSKERRNLVQLWRGRETIAMGVRNSFEDLKSEWEALKRELNAEAVYCRILVEILLRQFQSMHLMLRTSEDFRPVRIKDHSLFAFHTNHFHSKIIPTQSTLQERKWLALF